MRICLYCWGFWGRVYVKLVCCVGIKNLWVFLGVDLKRIGVFILVKLRLVRDLCSLWLIFGCVWIWVWRVLLKWIWRCWVEGGNCIFLDMMIFLGKVLRGWIFCREILRCVMFLGNELGIFFWEEVDKFWLFFWDMIVLVIVIGLWRGRVLRVRWVLCLGGGLDLLLGLEWDIIWIDGLLLICILVKMSFLDDIFFWERKLCIVIVWLFINWLVLDVWGKWFLFYISWGIMNVGIDIFLYYSLIIFFEVVVWYYYEWIVEVFMRYLMVGGWVEVGENWCMVWDLRVLSWWDVLWKVVRGLCFVLKVESCSLCILEFGLIYY